MYSETVTDMFGSGMVVVLYHLLGLFLLTDGFASRAGMWRTDPPEEKSGINHWHIASTSCTQK